MTEGVEPCTISDEKLPDSGGKVDKFANSVSPKVNQYR